jgi:hypothetical protein
VKYLRVALFMSSLILSLASSRAFAGDSTQTMPKGIVGVRMNSIFVTGVDNQFGADGAKATIGDMHAVSVRDQGVNTVLGSDLGNAIFSRIKKALQASPLGTFGMNMAASAVSAMDLGQMKINVTPSVSVQAPTIMYGIMKNWNLIVTTPFVKMKTDVKWEYTPGTTTAALNSASALANAVGITSIPNSSQIVGVGQQTLTDKGYKPLQSGERSFMGDVRVSNLISLGHVGKLSFGAMNTIGLPTGPSHDSDDLLDSGNFHHTFISQELTAVYEFSKKFQSYASAGIQYNLEESTNFRVPVDMNDQNPDASQKEDVTRQVGLGKFVEAGIKFRALPRFQITTGLMYRTKDADKFTGNRGLNYAVLEQTYPYNAEQATSYKIGLTYDPLSNYQMGSIPLMFDVNYEEVFAGSNTSAVKQLMFALSTFF